MTTTETKMNLMGYGSKPPTVTSGEADGSSDTTTYDPSLAVSDRGHTPATQITYAERHTSYNRPG